MILFTVGLSQQGSWKSLQAA